MPISIGHCLRFAEKNADGGKQGSQAREFVERDGTSVVIALRKRAACTGQEVDLLLGFHAFAQDVDAQTVGDGDDALDQVALAGQYRGVFQKTFIDLDGVHIDLAKQVDG